MPYMIRRHVDSPSKSVQQAAVCDGFRCYTREFEPSLRNKSHNLVHFAHTYSSPTLLHKMRICFGSTVVLLSLMVSSSSMGNSPDEKWSEAANACLPNYNTDIVPVSSVEECMLLCEQETQFQCLSFELTKLMNCQLSDQSEGTIPSFFDKPCNDPHATHIYLERNPIGPDVSSKKGRGL